MRNKDQALSSLLENKLIEFSHYIPLKGITQPENLECLIKQMVDSVRRINYVRVINAKTFSPSIADPSYQAFNPLKAAVWYKNQGNNDEAFWLIFLYVHFGKHKVTSWKLIQDIYGSLGAGYIWNWQRISANAESFRQWLSDNQSILRVNGRFGNHRKYESLNANSSTGTAAVILSYIQWVTAHKNHTQLIDNAKSLVGDNPQKLFNYLYKSMNNVMRFGRTAKFDYLTMIGKIGLANLEPGSAYLSEATGPLRGARLLFGGHIEAPLTATVVEPWLQELNDYLGIYFGMQVLEDSLCNWQKSPGKYIYFNG